jgi:hypothetical protein
MSMTTNHPLISYYAPEKPSWPLILVIGREPFAEVRMGNHVGLYDLPAGSKTPFWTRSHKAIAAAARIDGLYLWGLARRFKSSPIAYSDASPIGFNGNGRKKKMSQDEQESHAQQLASLLPLLDAA